MLKLVIGLLALAPICASALNFDADVPLEVKNQIITDVDFMRSLRSDKVTPLHRQVFGGIDGSYGTFFDTRVKGVGMSDCGDPAAVACVSPFFDSSKIWLTENYTRFSHPQIAKMMIVYHEARHTERQNGNWGHANCPRPFLDADGKDMKSIWTGSPLAGKPACDSSPFGSYGSSTILMKNVEKFCTNCTEKVRMDAGLYADDQFKRVTNPAAKAQMLQDFSEAQ